jgi:hypothetical protein
VLRPSSTRFFHELLAREDLAVERFADGFDEAQEFGLAELDVVEP